MAKFAKGSVLQCGSDPTKITVVDITTDTIPGSPWYQLLEEGNTTTYPLSVATVDNDPAWVLVSSGSSWLKWFGIGAGVLLVMMFITNKKRK